MRGRIDANPGELKMLHVVKLIQGRFPNSSNRIIGTLLVISASAMAVGVGILLLNK